MKILVFLGVVFKNAVQGGSQKVLCDVSKNLANRGHSVTIVCPRREDNTARSVWTAKFPSLTMKGSFPQVVWSTAKRKEGSWRRDCRLSL